MSDFRLSRFVFAFASNTVRMSVQSFTFYRWKRDTGGAENRVTYIDGTPKSWSVGEVSMPRFAVVGRIDVEGFEKF